MNKHKIFRGVRNILEGEPDDWLGQESVLRSLGITNIHINLSVHYLLSIPLSIILCNWDAWERSWPLAFARANSARAFRPIHTRDFAPGACSRHTPGAKVPSVPTISWVYFIRKMLPGQIEGTWKRSLVCTDTCKKSLERAPGAKPLGCVGLWTELIRLGEPNCCMENSWPGQEGDQTIKKEWSGLSGHPYFCFSCKQFAIFVRKCGKRWLASPLSPRVARMDRRVTLHRTNFGHKCGLKLSLMCVVALRVKQYNDVGTRKLKFFVTTGVSFSLMSIIFAGDSWCLYLRNVRKGGMSTRL